MRKECFAFLEKNPDAPCLDQESLNFLLQDDCLFLEEKFNLNPEHFCADKINPHGHIFHFNGSFKPWKTSRYPFLERIYWKYFSMTPWGEDGRFFDAIRNAYTLDEGLLKQPIRSRKTFIKNFCKRLLREVQAKRERSI